MRGLALDMRVALGGGRQGAGAGIGARITVMTNSAATLLPPSVLEPFCRRWRIREFAVFGSILGPQFRPDSDIDVLVTFDPGADWSLIDLVRMEEELSEATGRRVDLLTGVAWREVAIPSDAPRSSARCELSTQPDRQRDAASILDALQAGEDAIAYCRAPSAQAPDRPTPHRDRDRVPGRCG